MDTIKYFFRINEDQNRFESYSLTHLLLVVLMIGVSIILYLNRERIRNNKSLDKIIKIVLMGLIIFQQGTFLYFNFVLKKNGLTEGLPLYTCRAALYTSFFALATNLKIPKAITAYWGFIGGIIPMISPDLDYYLWPHITVVNYFLTHFSIFWTGSYMLFVEEFKFTKNTLYINLIATNIFLTISLLANKLFNANYAYLSESPIFKDNVSKWPRLLYLVLIYVIYNLFVLLVHIISVKVHAQRLRK